MARVIAIDYGTKRIGFAVTDTLQIAVHSLCTKEQHDYWSFLVGYLAEEEVEKVVIGYPSHADGTPTKIYPDIRGLSRKIRRNFPNIEVVLHPEDYSSVHAARIIRESGLRQKKRREKGILDKMSAVLILQDYLGHI